MTVRVDNLTPVLDAAPGELVVGRVRVVNDGPDDASYRLRVVGLDGNGVVLEVPGGPVGAGSSADVDVPLDVPTALGVGHHAVALEVSSDRPGDRPALVQLTVSIDSLQRVQLTPTPSTVRAGRSGRFTLDVVNHEPATVDVALSGAAADVAVRFAPAVLRLHPGERGWVRGRVRARQRWGGESVHHLLTLTARGRSSTTSTTMAYIQRPVFPGRARNAVAALVVVALFLGAIGGAFWWYGQRDTTEEAGADTDGDGRLDPITGEPVSGDGGDGGAGGDVGAGGGSGGGGSDGGGSAIGPGAIPTYTLLTGSVTTTDGDSSGVTVRMDTIDLDTRADDAAPVGLAGRSRPVSKRWSARHSERSTAITPIRQTESIQSIQTDDEGLWQFSGVPIRQNYEVVFAKPGYTTRSYVVSPPDDGSSVELDVELEPADGRLSGTVFGPDGPLGGVDIAITDGTLVFRTTSASQSSPSGGVGSFALEGLSTPSVYTLTASAAGFGNEVLQLPLAAGQTNDGVSITMRSGVGSIAGRITTGGVPRGGVTITASDGDVAFTTTSLTEGDVGSYNIPGLAIPGQYTVTAALDGYIAQTRRVELVGNIGSVDFELVPTTAGISGRVFSSNGNPIVGAGVTISLDDVSFRTATARDPIPGTFDIVDLPPGTYLVRIARFDHLPFTQQVTVTAGQTADLGDIVLEFTPRPPIAALGSISVRVEDAEGSPLTGSRVEIYALDAVVGEDPPLRTASDTSGDQFTFVFENIPVGSYRVRGTRNIYRPANERVSVGLGRESVSLRLLRLGQASGQLVDAFTEAPLRNYEVAIYRVNSPTSETFIETRPVAPNAVPDDTGRIPWQSTPNSLISGTYRVEITRPPPGYAVIPDQVIDPAVTTSPPSMRFVVPEDSEEPVVTSDIEMAPYPLVGGRLFAPQLDAAGETSLVPLEDAEVESLAADGLEVELVCGDNSALADLVPLEPRDAVQPSAGFTLPELGYHFEFTPFVVEQEQLLGACRLEVRAPDFVTASTVLSTPLAVSDGFVRTDRTVNIPVFEPVDPLFGSVFWLDAGERVYVPDVAITSDPRTVVGGDATESGDPATIPDPQPRRAVVADTSTDPSGEWTLDGQVFGRAVYTFDHPDFARGQVEVIISTDAERVVQPFGGDAAGTNVTLDADGGYGVELTNPGQGPLSGTVRILTRRGSPDFEGVGRSATGPGTLDDIPYLDDANPRRFGVDLVDAGTWTVLFEPPPELEFFGDSASSVSGRVLPTVGLDEFDTELVELGTVSMEVGYGFTDGLDPPAAGDPPGAATYRLDTTDVTFAPRVGTDDVATFTMLPVDPSNPVTSPVRYELDVTRPGFDELAAAVAVVDVTPAPTDGADPDLDRTGSVDVPLDVRAGSELAVAVDLPQYGSFSGTVLGLQSSDTIPPLVLRLSDEPGGLEVTAHRVLRADGSVIAPGDPDAFADRVRVLPPADDAADDVSFVVTGPPGYYDIAVSHPSYQATDPPSVPVFANTEGNAGNPYGDDPLLATPGRVLLVNETAIGPVDDLEWALDVVPGNLELTVFDQLDFTVPTAGARVVLTRVGDGTELAAALTGADGVARFSDLPPDNYRVEIRRYTDDPPVVCADDDPVCEPSQDLAFPVIITVEIAPGSDPERLVEVSAVMPSLLASIQGDIIAVNTLYDPDLDGPTGDVADRVAVPTPIRVERSYAAPSAVLTSDGDIAVPNEATDDDLVPAAVTSVPAGAPAGTPPTSTFTFGDLPGGAHDLTFALDGGGTPPGYALLGPDPHRVEVAQTGATATLVVYQAYDVELVVELEYPDVVTPELRDPVVRLLDGAGEDAVDVGAAPVYVERPGGVSVSFADVPPRTAPYVLSVTDDLAEPTDPADLTVVVVPNGDGDVATPPDAPVQVQSVPMSGNRARVSGTLQQVDPQGESANDRNGNLQGPATVELYAAGGATPIDSITVASGANAGTFQFEVAAGSYEVRIAKTGYFSSTATSGDVVLGQDNAMGIVTVRQQHVVTVSIAGVADDGTTVTVEPTEAVPGRFSAGARTGGVTGANRVWDFNVEPGRQYRFRVSRPGHFDMVFPTTTTALTAPVGRTTSYQGTLVRRIVDVAVTGPLTPEDDPAVVVTVAFTSDGVTYSRSADAPEDSGAATPRFTSTDSGDPISLTAPGWLTVSAPGFRTLVLPAPDPVPADVTSPTWPVPGYATTAVNPGTTQASRTRTVPVTLAPAVTTISGTLTGTTTAATVSLFSGGIQVGASVTSTGGATNSYSFTGTFAPGTYDVVVDQPGVGAGNGSVAITATSPSGTTATVPAVAITARPVTVTFTVAGPAPSAVTVWSDGTQVPATAVPAGTPTGVQFTRAENVAVDEYEFRSAGRIWQTETPGAIVNTAGVLTASGTVALAAFPTFTGTVSDDDGVVGGVEVSLRAGACPPTGTALGTADTIAADPEADPPVVAGPYAGLTSAGGGAAGSYCISAASGGLDAAQTVTIPIVAPATTTVNLLLE